MRSLALLVLTILATLPLAAHDHDRGSRRRVVLEQPWCAPEGRWEGHRWEGRRWEERRWERRHAFRTGGCEDSRVIFGLPLPRPLPPPFGGRIILHLP